MLILMNELLNIWGILAKTCYSVFSLFWLQRIFLHVKMPKIAKTTRITSSEASHERP